jgi:hypothetical protein
MGRGEVSGGEGTEVGVRGGLWEGEGKTGAMCALHAIFGLCRGGGEGEGRRYRVGKGRGRDGGRG